MLRTECPGCGCIPLFGFVEYAGSTWCSGCFHEHQRSYEDWLAEMDAQNEEELDDLYKFLGRPEHPIKSMIRKLEREEKADN